MTFIFLSLHSDIAPLTGIFQGICHQVTDNGIHKETIDTISGNVRRAFIGLYEEKRLFGGQNSPENKNQANDEKLKHIIALLLEDAKRLQQLEPNAGTEARIWIAMKSLKCESSDYFKTTIKTTQLSGELLKKLP